jgi:hypothetical protein
MDAEDQMEPMITPRLSSVLRTGCACRSDLALAHVGCLARAAEESKQDFAWWSCRTCKKVFTGPMRERLAAEFLARTSDDKYDKTGKSDKFDKSDKARRVSAEMNVATAARLEGRYADAAKMHKALYDRAVAEGGDESLVAIKILTEMVADASGVGAGAASAAAAKLGAQLLDVCERALGPKHTSTIRARSDLAVLQCREGRGSGKNYAELERTLRGAIEDAAAKSDSNDNGLLLRAKCNLCVVLRAMHLHADAYEIESEVLSELTRVFGRYHPNTVKSKYEVACDLSNAGRHEQAAAVLCELEEDSARVFGPTNIKTRLIASKRALAIRNTDTRVKRQKCA